jgi:hypothetical protein
VFVTTWFYALAVIATRGVILDRQCPPDTIPSAAEAVMGWLGRIGTTEVVPFPAERICCFFLSLPIVGMRAEKQVPPCSLRSRVGMTSVVDEFSPKTLVRWFAGVFFQPLQFFADFDFSVPRIFVERVAFAGKDKKRVGDAERVERVFE